MTAFLHILFHNIIPLSVLIGLGVLLEKAFRLDIRTLSKLNFYLFSPAIIFKMIYESEITGAIFLQVLLFFGIFFGTLFVLAELAARIRKLSRSMRVAMRNSVVFYNSANYGIPLNQLVFAANPFAMSIQIIIMMMQSLIPNTYGVYSVNAYKRSVRDTVRTILSLPVVYMIPAAFLLRGFHVQLPDPVAVPLGYIAGGFIATALVTLGVQLGGMKWTIRVGDVLVSNVLRLVAGPLLGAAIVLLLGIDGLMAQALVLSCAVPTSLSSVLLAVEFDNEPEFAAQAAFSATVFSILTVTVVIYLLRFVG